VAHRFEALPGRGFGTYARACWSLWRTWEDATLTWEAEQVPSPHP